LSVRKLEAYATKAEGKGVEPSRLFSRTV